jgi:hypothetical protein
MWLVSLPVDQLLHHPPTDLTVAKTAETAQEEFEQARNAEIDVSIAAITIPWALTFADMQVGSFAPIEVLEHPWQP